MHISLTPEHLNAITDVIWAWMATFLPRLGAAIAILFIGSAVARWAARAVLGVASRARHLDATVQPLIGSVVRYSILIMVFIAALSQLGVQTASLFAVLGAAGLAVGLALQGTLSNIAAGIMLLWLRPFRLGDYIEVGAIGGTVRRIDLFVCHLQSLDGIFLFVPNSAIWNSALKNHSRNAGRLVSVNVTVPGAADIEVARRTLLQSVEGEAGILDMPAPRVVVESGGVAAIVLSFRLWVRADSIAEVQARVIERAKRALEAADAETLTPQAITRVVPADSDPSRYLTPAQPYID